MIAVSDTGPLLYLSLIDCTDILPQMFERVLVPCAVADELSHPSAPVPASRLIEEKPQWLHICSVSVMDSALVRLGPGEREAIALTVSAPADVLLTDDAAARSTAARVSNVAVSGTIGLLYEAAKNPRIRLSATEFDSAIGRLKLTSFYFGSALQRTVEEFARSLR